MNAYIFIIEFMWKRKEKTHWTTTTTTASTAVVKTAEINIDQFYKIMEKERMAEVPIFMSAEAKTKGFDIEVLLKSN